jgi:hypothetical protein
LYYFLFFAEARGIFVDGVKVCLSLDCGGRVLVLLLVFSRVAPSLFSEFDRVSAWDWSLQVMDLDFLFLFFYWFHVLVPAGCS